MKKLRKYQIDGEFSNMKELKGVTTPFRDSYWYDQSKKNFPRHYKAEYALQNDPQQNPYAWNETYGWDSKYHTSDGYLNEPLNTNDPNFLQKVIDYTKIAYGPEYYNIRKNFSKKNPFTQIWLGQPEGRYGFYNRYGVKNNDVNFDENDVLLHNINLNYNYLAQNKTEDDFKNINSSMSCWVDADGLKHCGPSLYELAPNLYGMDKNIDHEQRFERVKKYMPDSARRTYQIATQDFTPYDFEGLVNQPESYRMTDESENTPIAYGPDNETSAEYEKRELEEYNKSPEEYEKKIIENYYKSPEYAKWKADSDKEYEERSKQRNLEYEQRKKETLEILNRKENLETLNRKEINQLPLKNVKVPDINRKSELLPESKPIRAPKVMELTPEQAAEFYKKNNIQKKTATPESKPARQPQTKELTPAEVIEFKKKYNLK